MADRPVVNASEGELARAVEENIFAMFRSMARLPAGEIVEGEKVCFHYSPPASPNFKGAWRTRVSREQAASVIDETIGWFKARRAHQMFWWTGPQTSAPGLDEQLLSRGFTKTVVDAPGMAADLDALDEDFDAPEGFEIVIAESEKEFKDWREVFSKVYEAPLSAAQAWVDATRSAVIGSAPWQLYVGYLNGKAVATNLLFTGAGVAGIHAVGTLPEARGRKIGAAITLRPLVEARRQGYKFGVLFSTEIAYHLYLRLGFRDVNCKISRYLLSKGLGE